MVVFPMVAGAWQSDHAGFDGLSEIIVDVLASLRITQRRAAEIQGLAPCQWSEQLYARPGAHLSLRRLLQLPTIFHRLFWPRFFKAWFGWDMEWQDQLIAHDLPLRTSGPIQARTGDKKKEEAS